MSDFDVIVVGAGPVGSTVAAMLGHHGVRTLLIERAEQICQHPRAQTIDDESMRSLQILGVAQQFESVVLPADGSRYYDADGTCFAEIGPGPQNFGHPKRSYMLQQKLDALIFESVQSSASVSVQLGCEVTDLMQNDDGVTVSARDGRVFRSQYVLACDGGQSSIRNKIGVTLQGQTYEQAWIVLDAVDDPDTDRVSKFFCDPHRPHVSICSPEGGRRYEWMLREGETTEQVLSDDFLAELLKPFRSFDPARITRRAVYTFHSRIASELRKGRVLLLGDAAHLTPPFAGQGMNAGIRDAHNVAWKLAGVVQHGWHPGLLDTYESERRDPIWAMIQIAVAMGEFVMPMSEAQVSLTRSVMMALERFPEASDWLFQMKFKPKPRYDDGFFVDLNSQPYEASLVGEMLPQPWVLAASGKRHRLDDLLGSGFSLIVQDDKSEQQLSNLTGDLWNTLAPTVLRLVSDEAELRAKVATEGAPRAFVTQPEFGRPIKTHRDQILLVRPDRYVAAACEPAAFAEMADTLSRMLATGHTSTH